MSIITVFIPISCCSLSAVFNGCTNINITLGQVRQAVLIRGIAGSVCFLFGVLALIFEIIFLCRIKANFLLRLFFYLTLSSTLFIGTFGLDLVHYFHYGTEGESDPWFCESLAFLAVYAASVISLFSYAIVFFLLRIVFNCAHVQRSRGSKCGRLCVAEIVFVTATFTLPLFIDWVPFLNDHYGNNPWSYCWFKDGRTQDLCNMNTTIELDEILLFYVPNSIAALSCFVCVVILIVWVIRLRCYVKTLVREKLRVILKEMFLFVGFMTAYSITWLVFVVSSLMKPFGYSVYTLWVLKSLANPLMTATIPSSFFFYLFANFPRRKLRPRRRLYSSIVDATTPPSTRVSAPSETTPVPFSNSWDTSEESTLLVN